LTGKFVEINENITNIMLRMTNINNEHARNLCKYISYTDENPLNNKDIDNLHSLLFTKIFPLPMNPDAITDQSTVVYVYFDDFEVTKNIKYKNNSICFVVLSELSSQWKVNGGLRPLFILNELDELFNNQRIMGLGTTQFSRAKMIWANNTYAGYIVKYTVTDFN
jgi:hypothetical protein